MTRVEKSVATPKSRVCGDLLIFRPGGFEFVALLPTH
jgi:hypothetical protein